MKAAGGENVKEAYKEREGVEAGRPEKRKKGSGSDNRRMGYSSVVDFLALMARN